jgi:hypothetical protein
MTLRMMDKYVWWNVRGGSWCKVDIQSCPPALLEWQRLKLPPPLRQNQPSPSKSNRNGCSRCGRDSHSVKDCFARTNVNGQALDSFDSESDSSESDQGACYRCGRSTHFAKDCYARTTVLLKVTILLLSLYLSQLYCIFKFTILLDSIMSS